VKEITLSLNMVPINMRIMSMNSPLRYMMPSIIMTDSLHLEELISMRAPINICLEGDTTIDKFIRNIEEPLMFNCISHINMAIMLTFPLVHIPPTRRLVTPSTLSFILMDPRSCMPRHLKAGTFRVGPSRATRETIDIVTLRTMCLRKTKFPCRPWKMRFALFVNLKKTKRLTYKWDG
jgi:hypothetical protein